MKDEIKTNNIPIHILEALGNLTNGALNYYQATETVMMMKKIITDYINNLQGIILIDVKEQKRLHEEITKLKNKLNIIKENIDTISKEQILDTIENYTGFWGKPDNLESEVN